MKKCVFGFLCALLSFCAFGQHIENQYAVFKNPDGVFESQAQYLVPSRRDYDMVVAKHNDPFLGANTKSNDQRARYMMNNRQRVTIYILPGEVYAEANRWAESYVEAFLGEIGRVWNADNKKGLGNNPLDKAFFGKMGAFADFVEKSDASQVDFKGDKHAKKVSYYVALSRSEVFRTLGLPIDIYLDTYCYYNPEADKTVAAIFYKIVVNQQALADPSFKHQGLRLMMELSALTAPKGKENKEEWDEMYKKIAQEKPSDMIGDFIKYFFLKVPVKGGGGGSPKKPEEEDDGGGTLGGGLQPIYWQQNSSTIIGDPAPQEPQKKRALVPIDIDESPSTVYVLFKSGEVMSVDKQSGKTGLSVPYLGATSIAYVGDDLRIYVRGKGVVSINGSQPFWVPVDPNTAFTIHSSADHQQLIAQSGQWVVTTDALGEELYAYELNVPLRGLHPDRSGKIWCADENRTLRYVRGEELGDYLSIPAEAYQATALASFPDGRLAMATARSGVLVPDTERSTFAVLIPHDPLLGAPMHTATDSKGTLYTVAEMGGLYLYRPGIDSKFTTPTQGFEATPLGAKTLLGRYVAFLFVDSMDNLWIEHSSQIYIYNPKGVVGYETLPASADKTVKLPY